MGGGVYASCDQVLVRGCEIDHNRADSNGGGIAGDFTVADLENNIIRGNRAREGGGIWLHETAATIADSWLAGNWAVLYYGGAVCVRNTSDLGTPQVIVRGSTLVGNKGGGLFLQDLERDASPSAYGRVNSSILWHNVAAGVRRPSEIEGPIEVTYSCIESTYSSKVFDKSVLGFDPLMARLPDDGGDGWGDDPATADVDESLNDDFGDPHLLPGSPCIQAGDPAARISLWAVDLDGQPRRMDKIVDMGVDEYTASGLAVLRPRGGEILTGGTTIEVVWQAPASDRRFRVEFSADGGDRWQVLDSPQCSGRLAWRVPQDVQSDACLIRVNPVSAWAFLEGATSDSFSIHPAGFDAKIASGWRTSGADFQRTGRSRNAGPLIGCLRWQFEAGTAITAGPVVGLNGRIHLVTWQGQVCTLDADSGRLLWACDTHDDIWGSPTVADDGSLYVSTSSGRVHEISPDGRLLRSFFVSPADNSPAILSDGRLALSSGVLNLATGDFWRFWMHDQSMTFASSAVGLDGTVYAAAWDIPGLYAVLPIPRTPKSSLIPNAEGRPFAGPVVGDNGLIYQTFVYDSRLYAVDGKTRTVVWTTDLADLAVADSDRRLLGNESWAEPVVGPDGTVYAGLDDPFVRAIDPATGRIKWFVRLGDKARCFTMAVDNEGYLFAAGDDGRLSVVNAEGREVSRFESGTPLSGPVIAAEGLLLVVGEKGKGLDSAADVLYAIEADPNCASPVLYPQEDPPAPPGPSRR